ncbi:RimJ/RimL family protein N-acetyltransferase [Oxalobacteraceae bacterium GrIS 1.11]
MPWHKLKNLKLENRGVQLRRIDLHDHEQLSQVAFDEDIWRYFVARVTSMEELDQFIEEAIRDTLNGTRIVFAIVDPATKRIVGSTAYGNIVEREKKLEIGWSWLGKKAQGTGINRATKLALLDYGFDVLGCERIEFKTDVLNTVARRGLAGIGAKEEGVLRSFNYMPDGRRRDAIYYSILRSEWPAIRAERFGKWLA